MVVTSRFCVLNGLWPALRLASSVAVVLALTLAPAAARTVKLLTLCSALADTEGLAYDAGFAPQLEKALKAAGHDVTVVDVSIPGETALEARSRLSWILAEPFDGAIVELGASDAAKGRAPDDIAFDLEGILRAFRTRHMPTLLSATRAPEKRDADYRAAFDAVFPRLAVTFDTLFYSSTLEGVAGDAQLNQADGLHPNADGIARIVQSMLPAVEALVSQIEAPKGQ